MPPAADDGRDAVPVVPAPGRGRVAAAQERPQHLDIAGQSVTPRFTDRSSHGGDGGRVRSPRVGSVTCSRWTPTRGRSASTRIGCGGWTTCSGPMSTTDGCPGWTVVVTRRGKVAHLTHHGLADLDSGRPVGDDTLWRIYSMTKPITSVAAMMLYEQGALELTDPVSRFIPEFAEPRVYVGGFGGARRAPGPRRADPRVAPAHPHRGPDLRLPPRARRRRDVPGRGLRVRRARGPGPRRACAAWARLPLLFDPGTEWNYSVATDVLGRVVEVVSGQSLDRFFAERILGPLGMTDTAFSVSADDLERLATLYGVARDGQARPARAGWARSSRSRSTFFSGGGGLVSTAADYHRFTQMLARGGELDGVRLLSPRTVAYMTRNHLPGGVDLDAFGAAAVRRVAVPGRRVRPRVLRGAGPGARARCCPASGEYAWGGLARTAFYVDPAEEITAMFFTQLLPGRCTRCARSCARSSRAAVVD